MAILNDEQIKTRMRQSDFKERLMVTPLLSENQIGPASIDIRLGSTIIIPRKTRVDAQDVTSVDHISLVERRLYERTKIKYHSKFVLHPHQLILGGTYEYISLPHDIFATIASRSSWGRLGLVIATASVIQPGYKGSLTLDLCNLSESPIVLYPGLLVGQLVLYDVFAKKSGALYQGRYECPTEAGTPSFYAKALDEEMGFWTEQG